MEDRWKHEHTYYVMKSSRAMCRQDRMQPKSNLQERVSDGRQRKCPKRRIFTPYRRDWRYMNAPAHRNITIAHNSLSLTVELRTVDCVHIILTYVPTARNESRCNALQNGHRMQKQFSSIFHRIPHFIPALTHMRNAVQENINDNTLFVSIVHGVRSFKLETYTVYFKQWV